MVDGLRVCWVLWLVGSDVKPIALLVNGTHPLTSS